MRPKIFATFAALVGGLVALPLGAFANSVTIVDPTGESKFTVTYMTDQAGLALFGTPTIQNNTIVFAPNGFTATSTNGQGVDFTNASVHLRIDVIDPAFSLDSFFLEERGSYQMFGQETVVSATGQMRMYEIGFPNDEFVAALVTTPMEMRDGQDHDWFGNASIGPADGWGGAGSVHLTLQNNLFASTSGPNTLAFIEKKFEGVEIQVGVVPVPPAILMFASALLALGWRRG